MVEMTGWPASCGGRLIGEELADGVNLLVRAQDGVVRVHVMAASLVGLGMLLASCPTRPVGCQKSGLTY